MSLTPEQWTAIESIMEDADIDDLQRFKQRTKISIAALRKEKDFELIECKGCGVMDYAKFYVPVKLNDSIYYVCGECLNMYDALRTGDLERYGC